AAWPSRRPPPPSPSRRPQPSPNGQPPLGPVRVALRLAQRGLLARPPPTASPSCRPRGRRLVTGGLAIMHSMPRPRLQFLPDAVEWIGKNLRHAEARPELNGL